MTYHIGQVLPFDYQRGLFGKALDQSRYHAIVVKPNKERAVTRIAAKPYINPPNNHNKIHK